MALLQLLTVVLQGTVTVAQCHSAAASNLTALGQTNPGTNTTPPPPRLGNFLVHVKHTWGPSTA